MVMRCNVLIKHFRRKHPCRFFIDCFHVTNVVALRIYTTIQCGTFSLIWRVVNVNEMLLESHENFTTLLKNIVTLLFECVYSSTIINKKINVKRNSHLLPLLHIIFYLLFSHISAELMGHLNVLCNVTLICRYC